jgi:hypothetical protein
MKFKFILSILLVFTSLSINAAETLKKPDGKSADMTKPVQVYILMGQSNMLTFGKQKMLEDACKEGKYSYLVDESGKWTTRKDVRNIQVMGSGDGSSKTLKNEWMTISGNIGVEMGIGHHLGQATDAPVMILKSAIGNRSLGWDLLPPGSPRYSFEGVEQAGYKETIKSKTDSTVVPFVKGGDCYNGMLVCNMMVMFAEPKKYWTILQNTTLVQVNLKSPVSFGGKVTKTFAAKHMRQNMKKTYLT